MPTGRLLLTAAILSAAVLGAMALPLAAAETIEVERFWDRDRDSTVEDGDLADETEIGDPVMIERDADDIDDDIDPDGAEGVEDVDPDGVEGVEDVDETEIGDAVVIERPEDDETEIGSGVAIERDVDETKLGPPQTIERDPVEMSGPASAEASSPAPAATPPGAGVPIGAQPTRVSVDEPPAPAPPAEQPVDVEQAAEVEQPVEVVVLPAPGAEETGAVEHEAGAVLGTQIEREPPVEPAVTVPEPAGRPVADVQAAGSDSMPLTLLVALAAGLLVAIAVVARRLRLPSPVAG